MKKRPKPVVVNGRRPAERGAFPFRCKVCRDELFLISGPGWGRIRRCVCNPKLAVR